MSNDMPKRAQTLQRYMHAMQNGDAETIATLLKDAEQDRALENMLLEVNTSYHDENSMAVQQNDIVQAQNLMRSIARQKARRNIMQLPPFHAEDDSAQMPTVVAMEQPRNTDQAGAVRNAPTSTFAAKGNTKHTWYRSRKSWIAIPAAAILVFFVLLQSNGALASQILSFLHYQPVPYKVVRKAVTNLYTTMNDLGNFSSSQKLSPPSVLTQAQVMHDINFPLALPQQLPQQVGKTPSFIVQKGGQEVYTFSAAKAHAYLIKIGHGNVKIPAILDGATFLFTQGMNVQVTYEGSSASNAYGKATFLLVMEMPRSEFRATGKASVQNLRDFMLSLPNTSHIAVEYLIQNNGTIPFSVPEGMQPQSVTVHHVPGILVSDNTKTRVVNTQSQLSAMVQWQENSLNYMVTGSIDGYTMNTSQLLTVANSLH